VKFEPHDAVDDTHLFQPVAEICSHFSSSLVVAAAPQILPSPPLGAERVGVRWGSPPAASAAAGPSLSPNGRRGIKPLCFTWALTARAGFRR
jgi:hypothetical protein